VRQEQRRRGRAVPAAEAVLDAVHCPVRRQILLDLAAHGRTHVGGLERRTGVSAKTLSHHLGHLRTAGLVFSQRSGKHIEYESAPDRVRYERHADGTGERFSLTVSAHGGGVAVTLTVGGSLDIPMDVGAQLFLLGANGTGKSSLMHDFYRANHENATRVSAHRQSWFPSADIVAPQELRNFNRNLPNWDLDPRSRWHDAVPEQRPRMAITQLVDVENVRAREIAAAADEDRMDDVKTLSKKVSPVKTINELLRLSNLPIAISIKDGEQVVATKSGGPHFSFAELSDGERNALVIGAMVLTAPPGNLILIDEPERHLHRSIISPLLTELFARRPDCAFIVSTHEVMLPIDHPGSRVLLVRGCTYEGTVNATVNAYQANLLPPDARIEDDLRKDILGARQRILFVEGTGHSLDKPLYHELFPNVSVIAKASCRDVEHAVRGIRAAEELHWVKAFGIVDSDGRPQEELNALKANGIYAVAAYSVESVYYHPDVQRRVAERHAQTVGGDPAQRLANVKAQAVTTASENAQRLSERVAEKEVRGLVMSKLPTRDSIAAAAPFALKLDVAQIVAVERARVQGLIDDQDLASIINRYPIRETPALDQIARGLGFQNRKQYESAVLMLLQHDAQSLQFVQALFGSLSADILAAG
jgi:DNA-binding transcriptional ArsR family regulator/ABC-type Mn2+/Zn2+ transport system ATPase subunit